MSRTLTPAFVLSLLNAGGEGGGVDVSVVGVASVSGLTNDELVERDTRGGNLEESAVGVGRAGSGEEAGAGCVLSGTLCIAGQ